MAGEGVTAMIVAADAGDNPLADRREDRKAAAERERKAKVAKVASQATNAMAAVRAHLDYQTTLTLTRNLGPGALFTRARDVRMLAARVMRATRSEARSFFS